MPIRFKCPGCKKTLSVKEHLAGRKAACPACKKPIVIPAPVSAPADVDELAAQVLADPPPQKEAKVEPAKKPIKFTCEYCDAPLELPFSEAGKKVPCSECRHIVRVPVPEEEKPKDWRRQDVKKGPSGALINQPEQPQDAWSSQQKKNVSRGALREAGVIEDEDLEEPAGLGIWLKHGFWTIMVAGLCALVFTNMSRTMSVQKENEAIDKALDLVQSKGQQPAKVALNPLWAAEVHRAAGELYRNKRKAEDAKAQFRIARARLSKPSKEVSPVDLDLFLIDLALTQIELGGTDDEAISGERLYWSALQTELGQSLDAIRSTEARVLAMRLVGPRLLEKKQGVMAISLAGQLSTQVDPKRPGQPSPLVAQQVALLLARKDAKDAKQAEKLLKAPDLARDVAAKGIDPQARVAYVEGYAYQGNYPQALELALAKGYPLNQLEACLGGATIILGDRSLPDPAKEALPFVEKALEIATSKDVNNRVPPWLLFQLIQVGGQTSAADRVKELAKNLDKDFQNHVQLALVRSELSKKTGPVDAAILNEITGKSPLPLALGWEALARHNTRLGNREEILRLTRNVTDPESEEAKLNPFLLAGLALGEQDKRK